MGFRACGLTRVLAGRAAIGVPTFAFRCRVSDSGAICRKAFQAGIHFPASSIRWFWPIDSGFGLSIIEFLGP